MYCGKAPHEWLVSRVLRIGHAAWRMHVDNTRWYHVAASAVLESQARHLLLRRLQRSAMRGLQYARHAQLSQQTDVDERWRRRLMLRVSLPSCTSLPNTLQHMRV